MTKIYDQSHKEKKLQYLIFLLIHKQTHDCVFFHAVSAKNIIAILFTLSHTVSHIIIRKSIMTISTSTTITIRTQKKTRFSYRQFLRLQYLKEDEETRLVAIVCYYLFTKKQVCCNSKFMCQLLLS